MLVIPELIDIGAPWKVLPQGVHEASLTEVESRYATNAVRKKQMIGLKKMITALQKAGCRSVFLDGSFVTDKEKPGDFDLCWLPVGVDAAKLDPVFLDCSPDGRKKQKAKYDGESFPSMANAGNNTFFFNYFQKDKFTQKPKGIVRISL